MKNWHTEKLTVDDSYVDYLSKVPVTKLMEMFEIATFKHSNIMGLDHKTMEEKSNAFWVVTKMKLIPNSEIFSGDKIRVTTWTRELGTARALRDCIIKKGNNLKAKFIAEWCCLDLSTRRLRRMNSISYPKLEMEKTKNIKSEFTNLKFKVEDKDYVYTREIRSTDIDINNHTNNLKYN